MVLTPNLEVLFMVASVSWVGGWGFLMYRYPGAFARLNARLGLKAFSSPKYIAFTKKLGVVEMALAALAVINVLITRAFGIKW
jgi:hypothetical protein